MRLQPATSLKRTTSLPRQPVNSRQGTLLQRVIPPDTRLLLQPVICSLQGTIRQRAFQPETCLRLQPVPCLLPRHLQLTGKSPKSNSTRPPWLQIQPKSGKPSRA